MDREYLADVHPELIILEPPELDAAILGLVERCGSEPVLCYSRRKLIECFEKQGMSTEDAEEWIDFNIVGAYLGETTPMILTNDWGD